MTTAFNKFETSKVYCFNLSNYYPSYERLKSQQKHEKAIYNNKSYFQAKHIKLSLKNQQANLKSFNKKSQEVKKQQLLHENEFIQNKLNDIKYRKPEFISEENIANYYTIRQKHTNVIRKLNQQSILENNLFFHRRLNTQHSLIDDNLENVNIIKKNQNKIYYNISSPDKTLHLLKGKIKRIERLSLSNSHLPYLSESKREIKNDNASKSIVSFIKSPDDSGLQSNIKMTKDKAIKNVLKFNLILNKGK